MKTLLMLLMLLASILHAEVEENLFLNSRPDATIFPPNELDLKENYTAKFASIDYESGEIGYNIYHRNAQDTVVGHFSYVNTKLLGITANVNDETKAQIEQIKTKSVVEDSQTPEVQKRGEKVLDLGKFLVACMSVDSEYIDTASTITNNKITLSNGYTRAFNENVLDEKALLLYVRLFVNIDEFLQQTNSNVFFLFVVYILGSVLVSAIIAKLEDRDLDSMWERAVFAFVILIGFYLAPTANTTTQKLEVTRTHFQTIYTGYVLDLGVKVANDLTDVLNATFNAYHARNSGKLDTKELEQVVKNNLSNEKTLPFYKDLYTKCTQLYDVAQVASFKSDEGFVFPEKLLIDSYGHHFTERSVQRDTSVVLNTSLQLCHFVEAKIKRIEEQQKTNVKTLSDYEAFISSRWNEEQLKRLHKAQNDYVYQYGFIASPLLALNDMFAQNINMFERSTTNHNQVEEAIDEKNKTNGLKKGIVADSVIGEMVESLPFMLLPNAGTLKDSIGGTIGKVTSSVTSLLEKIPVIGTLISKVSDGIQEGINIAFAIMILKYVMPNLPILALMVSSFLVLLYYFLSIAIYINVSPFLASWAFAKGQTQQLKNFGVRGVVIALKPIILVITIAFATIGLDLLNALNSLLITEQFDNFFNLTKITTSVKQYFIGDYGLLFFKGCVSIFLNLSAMVLTFYIVFKGADLVVYKILGLPQNGGDVQSSIGDSISNKTKL